MTKQSLEKIFAPINSLFAPINRKSDPIKAVSDPIKLQLLEAIRENGSRNYAQFGEAFGVSEATVKRRLNELKAEGIIKREGSNKTGYWIIAGESY